MGSLCSPIRLEDLPTVAQCQGRKRVGSLPNHPLSATLGNGNKIPKEFRKTLSHMLMNYVCQGILLCGLLGGLIVCQPIDCIYPDIGFATRPR